ncbi:MAG: hydroxymethylpyrimidine/phosphomethylpyrimidine kinase [Gammaproteobacteria bacterium]|nr:hydroxymethylpyrimidine/phosphomethylpyrimidine kinase [Gammaproteobacteria bacterium]
MSESFSDSVLVFSGLDPSGGAGLSADIEAINQFGITALPIATTLTAQNTFEVTMVQAVDCAIIEAQFRALIKDIDFQVAKIGLLGTASQVNTIANCLSKKPELRIVLDTIVCSSSNKQLLDESAVMAMKDKLIPLAEIITPNRSELALLAPDLDEVEAVQLLGRPWTLVTGTDDSKTEIEHRLYQGGELHAGFNYVKLPGEYHGSGCTLASSISALLARGLDMDIACKRALDYCYQTLLNAKKLGKMQYPPNRSKPI